MAMILMCLLVYGAYGEEDIVELVDDYTAEDIYHKAQELVETYPDILKMEVLGYSQGNQPIFVLHLTEKPLELDQAYVDKMHFFIEGGIHSRENVGPVMLLRIVETYAQDYYDDQVLDHVSLRTYLAENVIHILPLTNPDGYNLANFGPLALDWQSREKIKNIDIVNYRDLKANLSGVDINRNFPGLYYDIEEEAFVDVWSKKVDQYVSYSPSSAFYYGPYAGSELETRILMDYILRYDFRNYLSFHSRGEIIYYHRWMLSDLHNQRSTELGLAISRGRGNGYDLFSNGTDSGSGYMTDYASMLTLKPSLTIETVPPGYRLPTSEHFINKAYKENLYVILQAVDHSRSLGYYPYRLYVDGKYIRDYEESVYAYAMADHFGGIIYEAEGQPEWDLPRHMRNFTRLQMLKYIRVLKSFEAVEEVISFKDTEDYLANQFLNLGLVTGDGEHFRPYDLAKSEEVYVLLARVLASHIDPTTSFKYGVYWAEEGVNQLLTIGILLPDQVKTGVMQFGDLEAMVRNLLLLD